MNSNCLPIFPQGTLDYNTVCFICLYIWYIPHLPFSWEPCLCNQALLKYKPASPINVALMQASRSWLNLSGNHSVLNALFRTYLLESSSWSCDHSVPGMHGLVTMCLAAVLFFFISFSEWFLNSHFYQILCSILRVILSTSQCVPPILILSIYMYDKWLHWSMYVHVSFFPIQWNFLRHFVLPSNADNL